jgi:protein-disulfide isomerase
MTRTIASKQRTRARARKDDSRWLIGSVAIAAVMVAGLAFIQLFLNTQPAAAPTISSGRVWGQTSAPVSIEIFSDFQCPVCARAENMLHQIAAKYLDTGKVKVIYRHFAFIGAESEWAAQAAECAGEQGQFWQYGNFLFTHQAGENQGAFARSNLKQFATQIGLDGNAFDACLDSGKYAASVKQDTDEGTRRGVRSTPTFFVNGKMYVGYMPADQFSALLESLLRR